MRAVASLGAVLLIVCGASGGFIASVSSQGVDGGDCGPSLLRSALDLKVLYKCLSSNPLCSTIEQRLETDPCRHLSFRFVDEDGGGDRDYEGCLLFNRSGDSFDLYSPEYRKDSASGNHPKLNPDTTSFSTKSVEGDYPDVAVPDKVAWRFLLYVTNWVNTPTEILDSFDQRDLRAIWCERSHENGRDFVHVYLKFYPPIFSNLSTKTWELKAEHTGNFNFGPLTVE